MTQTRETRNAFLVYLFMAVVGGLLLSLIGYGVHDRQTRASAFERSGVTVTATYIGGRELRVSNRPERPPTFRYTGQVRFLVDGRSVTAEAPVSREFYRTAEPGGTLPIRYLPDDPERVQIDPIHEAREFGFSWMIVLILVLCLGFWIIRKLRPKRKAVTSKPKLVHPELRKFLTQPDLEDVRDGADRTTRLTPDVHHEGRGRP